jgi:hypothetical protein
MKEETRFLRGNLFLPMDASFGCVGGGLFFMPTRYPLNGRVARPIILIESISPTSRVVEG